MWMSWCVNALYWWVLDPQLLAQCQARGHSVEGCGGPFSAIHLVRDYFLPLFDNID